MTKPSILILSAFTHNIRDFAASACSNHESYAKRHGYDYFCCTTGFHPFRHPSWSKVCFIFQALNNASAEGKARWDWVFWIDADAIFTNPGAALESFIEAASPGEDMIVGEDAWGINLGLWFVKNSVWCRQLLPILWRSDPIGFIESGVKPPIWIEQPRYIIEQSTLWHLLHLRKEVEKLRLVPYHTLGGYHADYDKDEYTPRDQAMLPPTPNTPIARQPWKPGDFSLHLAGVPSERKADLLREALSLLA